MSNHVILYGETLWESPYVLTVYVALREKGLAFETRTLDLGSGDQRAPEFRDHSLTGKVPTLVHDGFWLSESLAIVEYLEEVFAPPHHPPVLPRDLKERARARQVMSFLRSDFAQLRRERPTTSIFFDQQQANHPLSHQAQAEADKLFRVAHALVPEGATHMGSAWCVADVDLALMLMRLVENDDPVPASLAAYARAQWARPSVHAFATQPRPTAPPVK
ncbi:MAG: glutathione transferase [Myxococcales bacterium]|nr:glutathione transferase [Myxococcales bacterium]